MALSTYSSNNVSIAIAGQNVTGLAPDNFITLQRNSDVLDVEVGAHTSDIAKSIIPDKTGLATLSLQQNSQTHKVLSAILQAQDASGILAEFSMAVADPSGSIVCLAKKCSIKVTPEQGLGSSATGSTRVWVFHVDYMPFLGVDEFSSEDATALAQVSSAVSTILDQIGLPSF
jgi:hypothetical protein